jgi:hypothetical protein
METARLELGAARAVFEKQRCLTERDLSEFNYVSIGPHGFILINVKLTMVSRLENIRL